MGGAGSQEAAAGPRTARELLDKGRQFLIQKSLPEGRLEAELLCSHALGLERLQLFLELERPVTKTEIDRARELLVQRAAGVPTAYLVGEREFYARPFAVTPAVLIPRSETELIVDLARTWVGERVFGEGAPRILDVGTGSGVLGITLALELPGSTVCAVDVSKQALEVAEANASALEAEVEFLEGDGFGPFLGGDRRFDLIVSNPPYVRVDEAESLAPEVREHEPHLALFAPAGDPDHWVGRVVRQGMGLLAPGGSALVELGHEQAAGLGPKLSERGLTFQFHKDLDRHERVLQLDVAE